jgi:hypothetical protein
VTTVVSFEFDSDMTGRPLGRLSVGDEYICVSPDTAERLAADLLGIASALRQQAEHDGRPW